MIHLHLLKSSARTSEASDRDKQHSSFSKKSLPLAHQRRAIETFVERSVLVAIFRSHIRGERSRPSSLPFILSPHTSARTSEASDRDFFQFYFDRDHLTSARTSEASDRDNRLSSLRLAIFFRSHIRGERSRQNESFITTPFVLPLAHQRRAIETKKLLCHYSHLSSARTSEASDRDNLVLLAI